MRAIEALSAAASRAAALLAGLATLACLVLVSVSVAARYLFGTPLAWIDHVAGWLVLALVLLAAPEAQRRFEHIGVDVATERLGPRLAHRAHLLGAVAVAVVAGVLLWAGLETVAFSRLIGIETEIAGVPQWWVQALLPVGAAVLLLVAAVQVLALALGRAPPHLPSGTPDVTAEGGLGRGE